MQCDEPTRQRYQREASELLDAIEPAKESPWIMKKDAAGVCVKLEGGLCGIHKQYGDKFLGDACYFYPRITRALGDQTVMTATMSCPEVVRLALFTDHAADMEEAAADRLPQNIKNYLLSELTSQEALVVHRAFLKAAQDDSAAPEEIHARMDHVARALELTQKKSWAAAIDFYFRQAAGHLPEPQINPADAFNLLHALCGLVVATQKPPPERLSQTIADMEESLAVTLDWSNVLIHPSDNSSKVYHHMQEIWKEASPTYAPVLRRWLAMQVSLALFPFAGLGNTLAERMTIIGVRLATVKLALMSACVKHGAQLPQQEVVRIVQSLSRLLDHLADAKFSLQIYTETGWIHPSRMRGLLSA